MEDINRYVSESMRVRRTIQVYSEFFDSREAIDILSEASIEVSAIIQRSLHDEIIISLARLFDTDSYTRSGITNEYLSQRNILEKYTDAITPEIQDLKDKTTKLRKEADIRNYRDLKIAHNIKDLMTGKMPNIKHNISFESAVNLVETSVSLMIKLMSSLSGNNQVSVYANIDEKYISKGKSFIDRLKT